MDSNTLAACLRLAIKGTSVKRFTIIAKNETHLIPLEKLPIAIIINSDNRNSKGKSIKSIQINQIDAM